ncbi:hypothetical protein Pfo_029196 [Paulownia fortunei]|nr:hypothetical protein Pfo_029196 [Paulownia fortunei]
MSTFRLSKIHCPCQKCGNLYQFNLDYVRGYLYRWGISKLYKVWTFLGEVTTPSNDTNPINEVEHVSVDEEDDTFFDMLNDLRDAEVIGNSGRSWEKVIYQCLNKHIDCTNFSAFSFLVKLMHVKVLNETFSKPNAIPSSHYKAKNMLRELGLGYESIHACKNNFILFLDEHEGKDTCPTCKKSRFKYDEKKMVETDGVLRHPTDAEAWKEFNKLHEIFVDDPRNVHLNLTTDGFNPFENMSNAYSMWPVLLMPYNLFPWKMMRPSYMIMSLLIPGLEAHGKEIDVYLHPLINKLKDSKGYNACPVCLEDTVSQRLRNKICYIGHRWFLHNKHSWRKNKSFNGKFESEGPPRTFSGIGDTNWVKKLIFFELEYWSDLKLMHNLDVMYMEKNICDALVGTMLSIDRKSKDMVKAQLEICRTESVSHMQVTYSLCCEFCQFLKSVKFPNGYAANISRNINVNDGKLYGLKTYDCHILLQRLLPIAIRKFLPNDICGTIVELCDFFKKLTTRTLHVANLRKMEDIVFILYLETLKKYIRNMERLEGYVVNEVLTFSSLYMSQIKIRFNRPEPNKIINCLLLYITMHIGIEHMQILSSRNPSSCILQCHREQFPQNQKNSEATDEPYSLALGPDVEIQLYDACIVNGIRYHTLSHDTRRTTQNNGVSVPSSDEEFGLICIDTSKIRYEDDPFILKTQARQVYYLDDIKHGGRWKVVQKVKYREIYEVTKKEDKNSEEHEFESSSNNEPNQKISLGEISLSVREDLEFSDLCRLDIQTHHIELLDTQTSFSKNMHNFINNEKEDT